MRCRKCPRSLGSQGSSHWKSSHPQKNCQYGFWIREDPLWGTFLFVDLQDLEADLEVPLLERSPLDDWWAERIFHLFEARVMKPSSQVALSADASRTFIEFCNQHRREKRSLPPDEQRMAGARPEQVLKLALLFQLSGEEPDADVIEAETLETAVAVLTRLSDRSSWKAASAFAPAPVTMEVEIERMAMKVQVHGSLSKRDIFRRYNSQDYTRLEPILQKALEANLIQSDGQYFTSVN